MTKWYEKRDEIEGYIRHKKEELEEFFKTKFSELKNQINDLPDKLDLYKMKVEVQELDTANKDNMMKELRSWYYKEWEKNDTYGTIIMIPYDYFNKEPLVIHRGKRIEVSHFNNLTLDWDDGQMPNLTIDK